MKPNVFLVVFLLTGGVVFLCARAINAELRSTRLGFAAIACGLAGAVPALFGQGVKESGNMQHLVACGVLSILFAVLAVLLAIWSFIARMNDHGAPKSYPVAALICAAANLFCGTGLFLFGVRQEGTPPDGNTQRVWRSEKHGFEVTVPSEGWVVKPNPNVEVEFRYPRYRVTALVGVGLVGRPQATFDEAVAYGKAVQNHTATTNTEERDGPNRNNHPHWLFMGEVNSEKYFFGMSVTRVREVSVVLMFEGQYQTQLGDSRTEEIRVIRSQAELFLSSVK
jgi:hypothetical protein